MGQSYAHSTVRAWRLNAVEFHPAYHQLMDLAISNEITQLRLARGQARRPCRSCGLDVYV